MIANVRNLKRVLFTDSNQDKRPLKEFDAGVKKPAFRQNGYQLKFDSANSDKVSFDPLGTMQDGQRVEISFFLDTTENIGASILLGSSPEKFQIIANYPNIFINLTNGGVNTGLNVLNGSLVDNSWNEVYIRRDGGINFAGCNGDEEELTTITDAIGLSALYVFDYTGSSSVNGTLRGLNILNEQFLLEESYGNTIKGSDGTVGTINTSHASGQEYIDANMWEKKSFALEFDASNSEYLELDNSISYLGDFSISLDIISNVNSNTQSIIQGLITQVSLYAGGKIYYRTETDSIYLSGFNKLPLTGAYLLGINRVGNDTMFYVNGALVDTISGYNGEFKINSICRYYGFYFDGTVKSINLEGEQILSTEGLGNRIYGGNATINTSHASGIERINYGMWQKNGNVLKLQAANSDYVELSKSDFTVNHSDLEIQCYFNNTLSAGGVVFSSGTYNSSVEAGFYIQMLTDTILLFRLSNTSGGAVSLSIPFIGGLNDVKIEGFNVYLNGVLVSTTSDLGSLDFKCSSGTHPFIGKLSYLPTNSSFDFSGTVRSLSFQNEQFNFREGQGTTTTGSEGTVATINTSHASGTDYINSQVWNVETSKWIDYE